LIFRQLTMRQLSECASEQHMHNFLVNTDNPTLAAVLGDADGRLNRLKIAGRH
jgi:hypothetical protein